jgi:transposase
LSSFAYNQVIQYLKAAAFRAGVQIIQVNPAYTSTIGAVNYAARFGISIHQGAAIAIARRGLGLVGASGGPHETPQRMTSRPLASASRVPTVNA